MGAEHPSPEQEAEEQQDNEPFLRGQLGDVKLKETHSISIARDVSDPGRFTFNFGPRPHRDTIFTFLFIGTVLITYAFGFFAVKNAESDGSIQFKLRFARYDPDSGQCEPIHHAYVGNTPTHVGLYPGQKVYENTDPKKINVAVILVPIIGTSVLILPVGLAMLWLLHRYTRELVLAIVSLMFIVPVSLAVVASSVCLTSGDNVCSQATMEWQITSIVLVGVGFAMFIQFAMMCKNWSRLNLSIQILKTASQALKHNLSLLLLNPILTLVTVMISAPIFIFMWSALFNGKVAPDFDAIKNPSNVCNQATGAPCCQFQREEWVTPYIILAWVAQLWVLLVASQLQILVVSGTISQWYFAPTGSSTVGTTKRSLRNAFGPSFGTACLSSLMITIMMILKSLMDRAAIKIGTSIVAVFLRACFSWLFQALEFFTRFTSNFVAISGESFCTSARATCDLLRRNWLSTLMVEILVQFVLTGMVLTIALVHFFMILGMMHYFTAADSFYSLVTAGVCFIISLLGLGQISQVMSNVVNTVYICYAMDKDVGVVSKPEVHNVYMLLPPASSGDDTMLAVRCSPQQQLNSNP